MAENRLLACAAHNHAHMFAAAYDRSGTWVTELSGDMGKSRGACFLSPDEIADRICRGCGNVGIAAAILAIGSAGAVTTETVRAFTEEEHRKIIAGLT